MRRLLAVLVLVLLLLPGAWMEENANAPSGEETAILPGGEENVAAPAGEEGRLRALLVGCDRFVSRPDTGHAAAHNLQLLADALQTDARHYLLIRSLADEIASVDALGQAIQGTFQSARAQDISLLYLSTHGVFDGMGSNAGAALLLSDGEKEEELRADRLQAMLDPIPGKKILILDACNSGAFIGKGLSGGADRIFFSGPDYRVLTSAGGSEASWYWQDAQEGGQEGASYFAAVLANGLGLAGSRAADTNVDGAITLNEMYDYLCQNYAVATPQVYPQYDRDTVLYAYDPLAPTRIEQAVTDVTFEDTLLTAGQSQARFSFTVQRQVELYYQIVYQENGVWQFDDAQHFLDGEQEDGTVLPGRKARTLALDTGNDTSGYAMIQLITVEEGRPVFQGARLLCVQPAEGEVKLAVMTDPAFVPSMGQELCILAQHDVPCALTVNIRSAEGRIVRRLAYEQASRPQQLQPTASSFYWDGLLTGGDPAPAGVYTVEVRVRLGGRLYVSESGPVELIDPAVPDGAMPFNSGADQ